MLSREGDVGVWVLLCRPAGQHNSLFYSLLNRYQLYVSALMAIFRLID